MKNIPAPTLRNWFIAGLAVQLIAAWFSIGYHHPDEHFQVLEFCNYKLGLSPRCDIAWEFAARCRPALQPFIAYTVCRALEKMGMYNPFTAAFILRLFTGLLTWWATCRVVRLMLPQIVTEKGRRALLWCSFMLWFVPYIGVRFSAENVAGLLFFLGLTFLFTGGDDENIKKQTGRLVVAGLLLGVSFFIRIQMVFAVMGLGCWALYYRKWQLRHWAILFISGVAVMGLMVCIDHWFYGVWVFTPWNYFDQNILRHVAAKFGTEPFWWYFTKFIAIGVPPISVVLLPLFFIGIRQKKDHVFTWATIAFIAGHCLVGHKEMRFLFPVSLAFIALTCCGYDWLMLRYPDKRVYKWAVPLVVSLNSIMLVIKMCTPAHEGIRYYEAIYDYTATHPKPLLVAYKSPVYTLVGLCVNFYQPNDLEEHTISAPGEFAAIMHAANGRPVLFLNKELALDPIIKNYRIEKVYCILPGWMKYLNFTNWQSRSYIWTLYRVYPNG